MPPPCCCGIHGGTCCPTHGEAGKPTSSERYVVNEVAPGRYHVRARAGRDATPEYQGATWRDPLDWWFLLSGVALRVGCSAWAGVAAAQAEWRSWRD